MGNHVLRILIQVQISLCIIYAAGSFFPKDDAGYTSYELTLSSYTFLLSVMASAFGMAKFYLKGPIPLLPQNAPLGGLLSPHFIAVALLHTSFVCRTIAIEHSFLSSYRNGYGKSIDPLISEEYRLVVYLTPCIISLIANIGRISSTTTKMIPYFKRYPQLIVGPMFSPIMFEGHPPSETQHKYPLRIWRLGTVINSLFMGCLPPVILIITEHVRGVPSWGFGKWQESTALFKSPYANTIFASITFFFFLSLTLILFLNDKIGKCSQPCLEPQVSGPNSMSNEGDGSNESNGASTSGNEENIPLEVITIAKIYVDFEVLHNNIYLLI